MEILVGCGIEPQTSRVLCIYWDHLLMVAQTGKYYGAPLQGSNGVTYGDPTTHTILNTVVNAVIWHWMMILNGEEADPEVFGQSVQ